MYNFAFERAFPIIPEEARTEEEIERLRERLVQRAFDALTRKEVTSSR